MKFLKTYIFPALYGLLVYFTVRLLHDLAVEEEFWKRDWGLNIFEMACSVVVGYVSIYSFERLFRYFDRQLMLQFNYKRLGKELMTLFGLNLLIVSLTFIPMAAFTDDGLSWADFADLTLIPTFYAIIYYGISRSNSWLKGYVDNKTQLEKITNDHLQTELKFLKAQYHPHFLFNALNTVYFQMDEDVPGAKRSIEKFSELLRYQLYDQQQQVPILQEIEYLQSFVELQKTRSSEKLQLKVSFDHQLHEQLVFPLLFLPLVENAFKFIGGAYQMTINATLNNDYIEFYIENSVPAIINIETGGIGLENLKRRLNILYPERHVLSLEKTADSFKVTLKIKYER